MTEQFTYFSLQHDDSIRLLKLHPGSHTAPLHATYSEVQITDASDEPYTAISYTWGDPKREETILIDGRALSVTKNALGALKAVRMLDADVTIWIDAVCINQDDNLEKLKQVRIMRQVFAQATETIVWLGGGDQSVQEAFAFIPTLNAALRELDQMVDTEDSRKPSQRLSAILGLPKENPMWHAVNELYGLPWFRRTWIIQEIAVSNKLSMRYDEKTLDWEVAVYPCDQRNFLRFAELLDVNGLDKFKGLRAVNLITHIRHVLSKSPTGLTLSNMATIMFDCMIFFATNPRDKILGLGGLISDRRIFPTLGGYDDLTEHIYTNFTAALMNEGKDLTILRLAGLTNPRSVQNLPSWVPDYTTFVDAWPFGVKFDQHKLDHAAGLVQDRTGVVHHQVGRTLRLSYHFIDEVDQFGQVRLADRHFESMSDRDDQYFSWVQAACKIAKEAETSDTQSCRQLWRTMVAGATRLQWEEMLRPSEQRFQDYLRVYVTDHPEHPHTDSKEIEDNALAYAITVLYFTMGRRFAVTRQRRFSLLPAGVHTGDKVVIIAGSEVPFVIRRCDSDQSEPATEQYELIGDCYIDGIMSGEALEEGRLQELILM